MQPNDPPEQTQHPIDYLDSIATVPKGAKKGKGDALFFGGIIAALLIAVVVGVFLFLASGNDNKADLSTLSVRLANLQEVADSSQKSTVGSRLRATNTSLSLALANANRDIGKLLTESGIDPKKISPKITAKENIDELNEKLEDARLNGIFDRTYAREMSYQLDTTLVLLEQLHSTTKNEEQKEFLSTTHNNLKPLQESFAQFDTTTN